VTSGVAMCGGGRAREGLTKRWSRIAIASCGVENPLPRSAHRGRSACVSTDAFC
jgi:hypothetical protein